MKDSKFTFFEITTVFNIIIYYRYAQFRTEYSLDEIKNSNSIYPPLTKLQCSYFLEFHFELIFEKRLKIIISIQKVQHLTVQQLQLFVVKDL